MMEPRIFVLEDDPQMRSLLVRGLREEGYEVQGYATGSELLRKVAEVAPDLFVIDIGLPDTDGRDVCQAMRAQGINAPVLFLTARDSLSDRLSGFHVGGDDYLTKPFAFAELLARLEALTRRSGAERSLESGGLVLDPAKHAVSAGGVDGAAHPHRVPAACQIGRFSRERRYGGKSLIETGWSHGAIVYDNTLDAYIARLRRKMRHPSRRSADRDGARCGLLPAMSVTQAMASTPSAIRRPFARMGVKDRLLLAVLVTVAVALITMTVASTWCWPAA